MPITKQDLVPATHGPDVAVQHEVRALQLLAPSLTRPRDGLTQCYLQEVLPLSEHCLCSAAVSGKVRECS